MASKKPYKLVPELVPGPLWGRSAAQMLQGKAAWRKKIRPDALQEADNKCCICGASQERMICHGRWEYDDEKLTATLIGFQVHCAACDAVSHAGNTMIIGGEEAAAALMRHLCAVNSCTVKEANSIVELAMDEWQKRSKMKWRVEVAPSLVQQYVELAGLPDFKPRPRKS